MDKSQTKKGTKTSMLMTDPEIEKVVEELMDIPKHSQLLSDMEYDSAPQNSFAREAIETFKHELKDD